MTKQQTAELKAIADGYKTHPVQMAIRMKCLLRELSPADRHAIADTLRDMLNEALHKRADPTAKFLGQVRDANDRLD